MEHSRFIPRDTLQKGAEANNWPIRFFSQREMRCQHTGIIPDINRPSSRYFKLFMEYMDRVREQWGKPLAVTSGFRHTSHPLERKKGATGAHQLGLAMDVAVWGDDTDDFITLLKAEYDRSLETFSGLGIGVHRRKKFVHVDWHFKRPHGRYYQWHYCKAVNMKLRVSDWTKELDEAEKKKVAKDG